MTLTLGRRAFGLTLGAALALSPFAGLAQGTDTQAPLPEVPELVLGNPDAKVTVTEYASFTCPHCATFHGTVFKELKRDYIDTGKIRFVYREVFFDRYGLWAAMMARCGGEARYFGIAEILYAGQRDWAGSNDAGVVMDNLRRIGRTAGMTDEQLDACMQDGAMAQAMVAKFQADTEADKVDSTPSLIIDGEKHGNMSYAALSKILDERLAQ
ncbi:DsbA family protein [Ruixingdingia sedimenti]|uniref:DsbA family protein n=1 Tax=Ruixingdingia sedimenti TaxID=3073604 RepID=A0ABU1F9Q1_9RHOB|nr:DsbA family protein [Xinfangfangia sp. LG-4]MDR5653579.1 DsbA family protein [Xinfangfangia sp. LG-4]